jgi:N-acetylglucosamine-6-sulfatase
VKRLVLLFAALGAAMAIVGLVLPGDELLTENQRADAQSTSPPNIVFILTDDQAESTLSHMPNVQNLLEAKGRTFTNAFNVYPFCCPSRASIQRGQYAHNHQIFGNGPGDTKDHGGWPAFDAFDLEKSTVATWLDAAGYRTIHFGKYMNNFTSQDTPPPGWDVFGTPTVPSQAGETKAATTANRAMAQLREDAPKAPPVFLQVGFDAPHVPNDYESKYASMFVGEQVPRVPSYDEQDVADKPRYIREDKPPLSQQTDSHVHQLCLDNEVNAIEQNDCEYVRQLRNLQTVDRFLKDMTDYLAAQGELSNTYVIYYSDNGNHWGEHRLNFGKSTPYETDTGFPLLIRGPGIPEGTTSNKLIGNHDIAPTFAQIADVSTPPFVDGRSFLRVADADPSNDSAWRTAIYSEKEYRPDWPIGPKEDSGKYVPPWEAVREENLIYIRHGDDPWTSVNDAGFIEFYDLSADPYELRNLAYYGEVPQATLDRLEGRLLRLRSCQAEECRAAEDDVPLIDTTGPQITITTPPQGATYTLGQSVAASYSCTDADSGVASCAGPVANGANIDTSSTGTKTFSVNATDKAGNTNSVSHTYTVNAPTTSCTKSGTSNSETISGTPGDDVICGLGGNDILKGLGGNDTLRGGGGNDQLLGGLGNDTLDGGTGTDTASYSASLTAVSASLATLSSTGEGSDTFIGIGVENLLGSSNADALTGSETNNSLTGGGGNDQVIGNGGSDNLSGSGGNDTVNSRDGVSGNDTLNGGAGTDTKVTDATEKSISGFP